MGLDWVALDAEHGSFDWSTIEKHVRATVRSNTVLIVRVSERNISLLKRSLDIGADGISIPFVNTAEDVRSATSFAFYPPSGIRAVGGDRATVWGQCMAAHVAEANENLLLLPNLESVEAVSNIDRDSPSARRRYLLFRTRGPLGERRICGSMAGSRSFRNASQGEGPDTCCRQTLWPDRQQHRGPGTALAPGFSHYRYWKRQRPIDSESSRDS